MARRTSTDRGAAKRPPAQAPNPKDDQLATFTDPRGDPT